MPITLKCLIIISFNKRKGEGWSFYNLLINSGGHIAIPKQRVGRRSENFE